MSRGIRVSNRIIFDVFETACSALKEPSFYRPDWDGPLQLIGDVIYTRLNASRSLQDSLDLADEQFYNLIWSDTLDLALRIEKIGLQAGYEPLQLRDPSGLPRYSGSLASPPSFRFVDNLARARDGLWREFRPTVIAAVAALPPPLPRGLPVQCLATGFHIAVESAHGLTPFIYSRAKAVVFAEPNQALWPIPEDDEIRSVIGTFIDSFSFALGVYVLQGESAAIRQSRAMRAWKHALDNLSGRMAREEAHRTWKRIFGQALPKFELTDPHPKPNMEYPVFPFGADVGEYTEWNPAEAFNPPPAIKSRQLQPLSYLDCSVATSSSSRPQIAGKFAEKYLETQGFEPSRPNIWSLERMSRRQSRIPAVREGLAVSALLFLEHHIPNHKSILLKPFPSLADVRYPDVWLDPSFTEAHGIGWVGDYEAFRILESLSSTVPPSLLYKLTEASLDALFNASPAEPAARIAKLERLAYGFLSLLAQSDRPSLATKFILKTVIERPDSSSWHRQLMTVGFLRSLSPTQAKDLIQSLADAIQQKAKEAADFSKEASKPTSGAQQAVNKPYVKITTIKYLAQLLQGAEFISESFAVDILYDLFKTTTHVDVRAAIVESLMGMLAQCQADSSDPLGNRIFQVLESTIPIAGRLDERHQLQEEDWEKAERTGKLPVIYEQGSTSFGRCIPPILQAILNALSPSYLEGRWEQRLLKQILLAILETSTAENTRWLEIFTAKYGLDLQSLSLPLLPVKVKFLKEILRKSYYHLPASLMDLYHKFILTNISPPLEVTILSDKLEDPTLRDLPEVKHWLSHRPYIASYDGFDLTSLLCTSWQFPKSSITVTQIQTHVFEQAKLLLLTNKLSAFDMFMITFQPSRYTSTIDSPDSLKNAKPVLQRIISLIDSLRTPEWQRNHKRQPEILPQTLKYELWLLTYPTADAEEVELSTFAEAVRRFVREISQPGKVYHEELPEIHAAVKKVLPVHRAQVACLLGSLREELGLVDLLCVEIAKALFVSATLPKDESVIEDSRTVIRSWMECADEGVRRKGTELYKGKGPLLDKMGKLG
jgi:hypothetical protein